MLCLQIIIFVVREAKTMAKVVNKEKGETDKVRETQERRASSSSGLLCTSTNGP